MEEEATLVLEILAVAVEILDQDQEVTLEEDLVSPPSKLRRVNVLEKQFWLESRKSNLLCYL